MVSWLCPFLLITRAINTDSRSFHIARFSSSNIFKTARFRSFGSLTALFITTLTHLLVGLGEPRLRGQRVQLLGVDPAQHGVPVVEEGVVEEVVGGAALDAAQPQVGDGEELLQARRRGEGGVAAQHGRAVQHLHKHTVITDEK